MTKKSTLDNNNVGSSLAISFKSNLLQLLLCGGLLPLNKAFFSFSDNFSFAYIVTTEFVLHKVLVDRS